MGKKSVPLKKPISAYVTIINNLKFKGDIKLVVSREFAAENKMGSGRKIVHLGVFWMPGTI